VLAQGRDVAMLRRQLGAQAAQQLAATGQSAFERTVVTTWDFGDLPETVEMRRGSIQLFGYPAIVDQRTHSRLTVMDHPDSARQTSRAGIRRLFVLHVHDDLAVHVDYLPGFDDMALLFAPLGNSAELKNSLIELITDRAFLGDDSDIRTQTEFERRLRSRWNDLWTVATDMAALTQRILARFHAVHLQLADADNPYWTEALIDIRGQLEHLLAQGFLVSTPATWLSQFPRYLQAVQSRIRKLASGGMRRDHDATAEVATHWDRWRQRHSEQVQSGRFSPVLDEYRWLVEELRVSLFAQELRTVVPVSSKRLDRLWEQVG